MGRFEEINDHLCICLAVTGIMHAPKPRIVFLLLCLKISSISRPFLAVPQYHSQSTAWWHAWPSLPASCISSSVMQSAPGTPLFSVPAPS